MKIFVPDNWFEERGYRVFLEARNCVYLYQKGTERRWNFNGKTNTEAMAKTVLFVCGQAVEPPYGGPLLRLQNSIVSLTAVLNRITE